MLPDLAVQTAAGAVAIEVELKRTSPRRLAGILSMYDTLIEEEQLAGVIYVTGRPEIEELVRRVAARSGPDARAGELSFRTLGLVMTQARDAVAAAAAATPGRA